MSGPPSSRGVPAGWVVAAAAIAVAALSVPLTAQTLEAELQQAPGGELAALARREGDAARGAVVFFQPQLACSKCHAAGQARSSVLGPDLAALGKEVSDESLVESVLLPSKVTRRGFEPVTVVTAAGKSLSGLLVERTAEKLVLREVAAGQLISLLAADIEQVNLGTTSIMPAGQVNQLAGRQAFLDLIRFLIEIRDGGQARALELQPPAALVALHVPEYEEHLDHAGLIAAWDDDALRRGEAIYRRVCANCHGTPDKPGSLPTALRFAEGKFKNGCDPLSLYRTLTYGFGQMVPQTWMVPAQKYDVIHYLRATYLRPHNPTQWTPVDAAYLARLPKGDTRGPEPSDFEPWSAMDYGPYLTHTYEVPGGELNIAYKGVAIRLDAGAGGVSRGRNWMVFDTDTLRVAAAWSGSGGNKQNFIDWEGIQFNGSHGVHPRLVGQIAFASANGPGWSNPADGAFHDEGRVLGRDGRRYGPLPRDWAKYHGLYLHGQQVVMSYRVGTTEVLESPAIAPGGESAPGPLLVRTFNFAPRERDSILQVADLPAGADPHVVGRFSSVIVCGPNAKASASAAEPPLVFDGNTYLEVAQADAFDLVNKDFTIAGRIKTKSGGTIWSLAEPGPRWTPGGQTLFVRDGRLCFDIGWVGVVTGRSRVADDRWHDVAVTCEHASHRVRLYVDGRLDGEGTLVPRPAPAGAVARIGFTAPDFPQPESFFQGEIAAVRIHNRQLTSELTDPKRTAPKESFVAHWPLSGAKGNQVADAAGQHAALVRRGTQTSAKSTGPLIAGFAPPDTSVHWTIGKGALQLHIPAGGDPLSLSVWVAADTTGLAPEKADDLARALVDVSIPDAERDLSEWTRGGPPRWPEVIETTSVPGAAGGPFAADTLSAPEPNPWLAQTRFTGLDFLPDGRIAVCSWDGDVWLVEPLPAAATHVDYSQPQKLRWRRIASGLFQPLGLKVVDGKIHLTCRDQLVVLHDLNGDEEIDFYQCLNNDHQVTEHFHEFAMGLQTDAAGNFYYAKSARHGLPAVVPHHGTLLRVTADGSRTDILANGFRAANGVCLNPDGSFVVTDQEGFWNPKNRINWVTFDPAAGPKFYGNMLGYHDVTDASDAAMVPPLCWITNAFDRSPAELLWVESDRWGALNGALLNLSYGYGKVFVVPHENVGGAMQGGMIELPLPPFPTGIMRGRFHPADHELYLCGMFAWAGNATAPGGLYRLRATGQPMNLPVGLQATKSGLRLSFTDPLDPASLDPANLHVKTWSLRRTANYGSDHHDEKQLDVRGAKLSADAKTLTLDVAELAPTWCMEIRYSLRSAAGVPVVGTIHNTIHKLGD